MAITSHNGSHPDQKYVQHGAINLIEPTILGNVYGCFIVSFNHRGSSNVLGLLAWLWLFSGQHLCEFVPEGLFQFRFPGNSD